MSGIEIGVTLGAIAAIGLLAWFFFGPKKARQAEVRDGVQEVHITVKGGYSPDVIKAKQGVPLRLVFDRQEASDCTSRVVFSDFQVSKSLPAYGTTTLEFTPDRSGTFGFACGMNMLHRLPTYSPASLEFRASVQQHSVLLLPCQEAGGFALVA